MKTLAKFIFIIVAAFFVAGCDKTSSTPDVSSASADVQSDSAQLPEDVTQALAPSDATGVSGDSAGD